jgi:hypothetical protein
LWLKHKITPLEQLTNGQATSAALSVDLWDKNCPLTIYNIDTFIEYFNLVPPNSNSVDGLFPCFVAAGEHWSFGVLQKLTILALQLKWLRKDEFRSMHRLACIGLKPLNCFSMPIKPPTAKTTHWSMVRRTLRLCTNILLIKD